MCRCIELVEWTHCCYSRTPSHPLHADVRARVLDLCFTDAGNKDAPSAEAALCKLLRGGSCYDTGSTSTALVSFRSDRVAVPSNLEGAPLIADVPPGDASLYLDDIRERMLLPPDDVNHEDIPKPYLDPALIHDRRDCKGCLGP